MDGRSYWGGKHESADYDGSLKIERVLLNRGGYASGGQYFGAGRPLFRVSNYHDPGTFGDIDFHVRAVDRKMAQQLVRNMYPEALGVGGSAKKTYAKRTKSYGGR